MIQEKPGSDELFSATIKDLRQRNHLTQKELAEALYISPGAISQYEKGKNMPSRETIERMARYFSVSVDYLMGNSANEEMERLMNDEYCCGIKTSDFLKLCMEIEGSQRAALLTVAKALAKK